MTKRKATPRSLDARIDQIREALIVMNRWRGYAMNAAELVRDLDLPEHFARWTIDQHRTETGTEACHNPRVDIAVLIRLLERHLETLEESQAFRDVAAAEIPPDARLNPWMQKVYE